MTEINKIKITGGDIIAIISCLGMIGWLISDFFGGMIIILISYWVIVFPILFAYIISFFVTLISTIRKGLSTNKIMLSAHSTVLLTIIAFNLYNSDIFRSQPIMTALLKDDLFNYRLIFRKNGDVENRISGLVGYSQTFHGKYKIENNYIIFSKKPYDNSFIPDTLFIDLKQKAIFMHKDETGQFDTTKEWLNHLEIEK